MIDQTNFNKLLSEYKSRLPNRWPRESYKWVAVQHFQDNWDISATDFHKMLTTALAKTDNLLTSNNFWPRRMILEFAEKFPETVRKMFAQLFDESRDLIARIEFFKRQSDKLLSKVEFNQHYQNDNAISTYLWLRYPDKYYTFKYTVCTKVSKMLAPNQSVKKGNVANIISYFQLCDEICANLSKDTELVNMLNGLITKEHYKDKKLKTAVVDFCFFVFQGGGATGTETTKSAKGTNYWWLNANPKIWSYSKAKDFYYTLYNEFRHPRKVYQNFMDAKAGDIVIGYEASPVKKITALLKIAKPQDGKNLYFTKIRELENPISYQTLKDIPGLANLEFFKNPNGSLFKVTQEEFDIIMDVIDDANEKPILSNSDAKQIKYAKRDFLKDVFMSETQYDDVVKLLETKKNIILQGAPGVGKTYAARRLAYSLIGARDDSRVQMVQFHQNYVYEDFVIGYKPTDTGFELRQGVFYKFCRLAEKNPDQKYFFIIDEINRGNLSKIFGELLMLIETTHRGEQIQLAYTAENFTVPENLYIIGMMNTADRSLAIIDYALRRRFAFVTMEPGFESNGFKKYLKENPELEKLATKIIELNKKITQEPALGKGFCIGHSYLCGNGDKKPNIESIIKYELAPLIEEYWFDDDAKKEQYTKALLEIIK